MVLTDLSLQADDGLGNGVNKGGCDGAADDGTCAVDG